MNQRRDKWGDERDPSDRAVGGGEADDTAYVPRNPGGVHREHGDDPTRIVSGKQGFAHNPTEFMTGVGGEDAGATPVARRGYSPGDTVLVGGGRGHRKPKARDAVDDNDDPMTDPPSGWLVAIAGPAQGTVVTLRLGRNSIGRGTGNRVPLGERDRQVSDVNHCEIIYDTRNRKFFIQDKDSKNLTYVNDEAVLAPSVLDPLAHVRVGDTVLRFVPFCGPEFSWETDT